SVRGRLEPGLPGVALLALRSGVPVVPAGIRGTYEALAGRRGYIPRRVPLGVRFGPARSFSEDGANGRRSVRLHVTRRIMEELAAGTFPFRAELEDIHTNVERRLQELVGDVGGKLHTGRSRNDQIALDERLYLREVIARVRAGLRRAQETLVARAAETVDAPL